MRAIDAAGMKFKSAAAPPWNGPPNTARLAVVWRRLPLISTSAWFGLRPRSLADSVWLAMSPPNACAVNDGTICAIDEIRSGRLVSDSASAPITWIGAGLSEACRPPLRRVPVTMISSRLATWVSAAATCNSASAAIAPEDIKANSAPTTSGTHDIAFSLPQVDASPDDRTLAAAFCFLTFIPAPCITDRFGSRTQLWRLLRAITSGVGDSEIPAD